MQRWDNVRPGVNPTFQRNRESANAAFRYRATEAMTVIDGK